MIVLEDLNDRRSMISSMIRRYVDQDYLGFVVVVVVT